MSRRLAISLASLLSLALIQSSPLQADAKVSLQTSSARDFVFVFDRQAFGDSGAPRGTYLEARRAVDRFVRDVMQPGDRVAIAGYDARLLVFSDFTTDRATLERAATDAVSFSRGITPARSGGDDLILAHIDPVKMMNTGRREDSLALLAGALSAIPRQKALVLFSSGVSREPFYLDPLLDALKNSDTRVYAVNLARNERDFEGEMGLTRLTSSTRGDYFADSSDFFAPLRTIAREARRTSR